MAQVSAFENVERLVKRPASQPYDGIITEVFVGHVSVRKAANNQVLQQVLIADHIDQSKLKKGIPVRLGEHLGQPLLLAILPQLEGDINYAGKGSIIPSPPAVSVSARANGWIVTWTAVPGADRYRVYRNDTPDETTPDDLEYVTGTSLVVPYESTYIYFAVRACSGLNESELSGWVTDDDAPLAPNTFAALNDIGGHLLTIGINDVAMTHPGFKYFEIEQANDGSGTGAVSLGSFYYPNNFPSLQVFGIGTVKYYRIRAVDWAGNTSAWTAWDAATAGKQEVQDKFDGYGGAITSSLESLWWLGISDFDTDETWTSPQTIVSYTTDHKEGNRAIKIVCEVSGGFLLAGVKRTVSLNLSADNRFGNNDYVILTIYATDNAVASVSKVHFQTSSGNSFDYDFGPTVIVGGQWNYIKVKKSDFYTTGSPSWSTITEISVTYGIVSVAGTHYVIFDDWRIVKADPDDATTYNDTGPSWDRAANTGSDFGEWHIYPGNRSGEPAKPFSYGQIKTATTPAVWYLSHKPLATTNILTGTIQAGVYLKGADGQAGLAFFIDDVAAGIWDMYVVEADSSADQIRLVKWLGGTRTVIATAAFTFAPNQILWLGADFRDYDADAGRIKVFASFNEGNLIQAANLKISTQDAHLGSGGSVGLLSYQANARFVNFVAGSPAHADVADVAYALDGPIVAGETRRIHYNRDTNQFFYSDDGVNFNEVAYPRFDNLFGSTGPNAAYKFTQRTFVVNDFASDIAGFEDSQADTYSFGGGAPFSISTPASNFNANSATYRHFLWLNNFDASTSLNLQWSRSTGKNLANIILAVGPNATIGTATDVLLSEIRFWAVQTPGGSDKYWSLRFLALGSTFTQYRYQMEMRYGTGVTYSATDGTLIARAPFVPGSLMKLSLTIDQQTNPRFNVQSLLTEGFTAFSAGTQVAGQPNLFKFMQVRILLNTFTQLWLDEVIIT